MDKFACKGVWLDRRLGVDLKKIKERFEEDFKKILRRFLIDIR